MLTAMAIIILLVVFWPLWAWLLKVSFGLIILVGIGIAVLMAMGVV